MPDATNAPAARHFARRAPVNVPPARAQVWPFLLSKIANSVELGAGGGGAADRTSWYEPRYVATFVFETLKVFGDV
jgi:hypothetical protein